MHTASSSALFELPATPPASRPITSESEPTSTERLLSFQRMQVLGIRLAMKTAKAAFITALFIVLSWVVLSIQSLLINL